MALKRSCVPSLFDCDNVELLSFELFRSEPWHENWRRATAIVHQNGHSRRVSWELPDFYRERFGDDLELSRYLCRRAADYAAMPAVSQV